MVVASSNVGGLIYEFWMAEALEYLRKTGWMVICLTETHWDDELETIFRRLAEKDFWIFCKHRPRAKEKDDGSGGMAFLIRKDGGWDGVTVPIDGVAD